PVVPAGQETGEATPVLVSEVAEGTGDRLLDDHFAQLAHDQKRDEAADRVAEDHRRASRTEHAGRTEEQPGADRTTQRDQLDMPVFQAPLKRARMQLVAGHWVICLCL